MFFQKMFELVIPIAIRHTYHMGWEISCLYRLILELEVHKHTETDLSNEDHQQQGEKLKQTRMTSSISSKALEYKIKV